MATFISRLTKAFGGGRAPEVKAVNTPSSAYKELLTVVSRELASTKEQAPERNLQRVQLVQTNPVAFMCVRRISWSVGSVKWLVDGKSEGDLFDLLNKPSPGTKHDSFGLWTLIAASLAVTGNAYLTKSDRASGRKDKGPAAIYFLRPDRITHRLNTKTLELEGYEYTTPNGELKPYSLEEVCHIRHPWLLSDDDGVSVVTPAFEMLAMWRGYSLMRRKLLENSGGVPSALVFEGAKQGLSKTQREEFQELLDDFRLDGEKFGKWLLLDAGVSGGTIKKIDLAGDIQKLEPAASTEYTERTIANMFGVPRLLLGVGGDATFANQKEARRYFWLDTIIPGYLTPIAAALSTWLDVEIAPDLDDIPAISEFRLELITMLKGADWLTINEKREWMKYGKVKGGDDVLQPASLIPIGDPGGTAGAAGGDQFAPGDTLDEAPLEPAPAASAKPRTNGSRPPAAAAPTATFSNDITGA
jgi:HK97 family phage portal protein